jgi:hypothetical protein
MITALVQFKLPAHLSRDQVKEMFTKIAPKFRDLPGLHRKYFLISEDGKTGGGAYLWESKEDAERVYTDQFKHAIAERFGSLPSITYFESPVVVDNFAGISITAKSINDLEEIEA